MRSRLRRGALTAALALTATLFTPTAAIAQIAPTLGSEVCVDEVAGGRVRAGYFDTLEEPMVIPKVDPLEAALRQKAKDGTLSEFMAQVDAVGLGGGTITIPVVFHAISGRKNAGYVDDSVFADQIAVMNAGFAGTIPPGANDYSPGPVNTNIQFTLSSIERYQNSIYYNLVPGRQANVFKAANRQGGDGTLNVYVANLQRGLLGWATFPWDVDDNQGIDGVVIHWKSLPLGEEDGRAFTYYGEGDTLTHEVGHWLGLYHTFQGGCEGTTSYYPEDPQNGGQGDLVSDTPPEASPATACKDFSLDYADRDTCDADVLYDPVNNFMDYSIDECLWEFSSGQASRMNAIWLLTRV